MRCGLKSFSWRLQWEKEDCTCLKNLWGQCSVLDTAIHADCERVFSLVRNVHTEFMKSLAPETLTAFLQCKMNIDGCYDSEPQESHLSLAKNVRSEYNEER